MIRRVIKAQRRSRKQITTEFRNDLFNETLEFMAEHQIKNTGQALNINSLIILAIQSRFFSLK